MYDKYYTVICAGSPCERLLFWRLELIILFMITQVKGSHKSNSRPVGQMWSATSFYVAHQTWLCLWLSYKKRQTPRNRCREKKYSKSLMQFFSLFVQHVTWTCTSSVLSTCQVCVGRTTQNAEVVSSWRSMSAETGYTSQVGFWLVGRIFFFMFVFFLCFIQPSFWVGHVDKWCTQVKWGFNSYTTQRNQCVYSQISVCFYILICTQAQVLHVKIYLALLFFLPTLKLNKKAFHSHANELCSI